MREIQELAIPAIKPADADVIIGAATAAGKTEAAYLPALTHLLETDNDGLIVGIFPLKALINDQFGRLSHLCEKLEIPVWPWHGDISSSIKSRFLKSRKGVLLITPESLEATLCNRGSGIKGFFEFAQYFIVDELHYYIGSERGKQLQSLMHRIEVVHGKTIPRIGLSATLGDMRLAAEYLRPSGGGTVKILESTDYAADIKIQVKGYEAYSVSASVIKENQEDAVADGKNEDSPISDVSSKSIAEHLFKNLRGSNNLIFPNSRSKVEYYTYLLNSLCEQQRVSNEFWPHHGSLSKEIRAETEAALKNKERPSSAICTSTLELGIDIGAIKCVAQIDAPPSVASLRQRLGRSGRREGESAILRGYSQENSIDSKSDISDKLRLNTIKMCAMITLLLERWFEPPAVRGQHFSTLIQQLLSTISQYGGLNAAQAYQLLCGVNSPFATISKDDFSLLLKAMGDSRLIMQDSSGLLLHDELGEKFVNHYSFYAAFSSDEEYKVIAGGKTLGSLPISNMLFVGQHIVFAGKTWSVQQIEDKEKAIYVVIAKSGNSPNWLGGGGGLHTVVSQRMRDILAGEIELKFLDTTARKLVDEGITQYRHFNLSHEIVVGSTIMTWLGSEENAAIVSMLKYFDVEATANDCMVEIHTHKSPDVMIEIFTKIMNSNIDIDELLFEAKNLEREKWDWALPKSLLNRSFASLHLNVEEAKNWLANNIDYIEF